MLEFRILGPLEVVDDGGAIRLGGPKQRATLAILLLTANRVVGGMRAVPSVVRAPAEGTTTSSTDTSYPFGVRFFSAKGSI